jgi:hypothetical protein
MGCTDPIHPSTHPLSRRLPPSHALRRPGGEDEDPAYLKVRANAGCVCGSYQRTYTHQSTQPAKIKQLLRETLVAPLPSSSAPSPERTASSAAVTAAPVAAASAGVVVEHESYTMDDVLDR